LSHLTEACKKQALWESVDSSEFCKDLVASQQQQQQQHTAIQQALPTPQGPVLPQLNPRKKLAANHGLRVLDADGNPVKSSPQTVAYALVSEEKRYAKIFRKSKPLDLVQKYRAEDRSTRAMVDQVYTYMVVTRAEFALFSCYFGVYGAWRPTDQPGTLLMSGCFLHSTKGPDATAMGLAAFVQEQVLKYTISGRRVHQPNTDWPSLGGAGQGRGASGGSGGGARDRDQGGGDQENKRSKSTRPRSAPVSDHCLSVIGLWVLGSSS
jgi:hypothetical protein